MDATFAYLVKASIAQTLGATASFLRKADAHARSIEVDDAVFLAARLYPDMHALPFQVQTTSDVAARGAARLAGAEMPTFPDTETTLVELAARAEAANEYVQGLDDATLAEGATRQVEIPTGPDSTMPGEGKFFLSNFVLPNLHFHAAIAYGLLRMQGVPLGKRDFLLPGG